MSEVSTSHERRRVLHVTCSLDFGGVERHLETIAHAASRRYEHCFCAITNGGAAAQRIRATGNRVEVLEAQPWSQPAHAFAKILKLIRELRPAVVHGHGAEGNLLALPAALVARVPVRIAEEIGIPQHSLKARVAFQVVYLGASRVIAVSQAVQQAIIQNGEARASKVIRLYNPVELPKVMARQRQAGQPLRIGFVGRLEPIKNAIALVEAMALLPEEKDVRLQIIGDGSQRVEIERLIRSERLDQKIELAGFQANPAPFLAQCHLYVQPSRAEGFGIALVEAMACCLPVIASREGGMAELVEDGVNGWLLRSPEPGEIAEAISRAANLSPRALAAIGKRARETAERFDAMRYLTRLEDVYDELARSRIGGSRG